MWRMVHEVYQSSLAFPRRKRPEAPPQKLRLHGVSSDAGTRCKLPLHLLRIADKRGNLSVSLEGQVESSATYSRFGSIGRSGFQGEGSIVPIFYCMLRRRKVVLDKLRTETTE